MEKIIKYKGPTQPLTKVTKHTCIYLTWKTDPSNSTNRKSGLYLHKIFTRVRVSVASFFP